MIYISLGSNLGNRLDNLWESVNLIRKYCLSNIRCSIILETKAILPCSASADWDKPFLNMIVAGETNLSPTELLQSLQNIEVTIGRPRKYELWAPRIIDLDILFYNDLIINNLDDVLEKWSLLKHPFYQAWNNGILNKNTLNVYAQEYYHHVAAFPRYISQIHALCVDIQARQVLLENLVDEEQGDNNHPELWLRFIEGLGGSRDDDKNPKFESTKRLVNGFFELTQTDYPTGLGALYAYERQTPTVSKVKIDGLKKHYNIHNQRTLEFFVVHAKTDIWHTNELIKLINKLNSIEQKQVHYGAVKGAKLLWQFLDGDGRVICKFMPLRLIKSNMVSHYKLY